MWRSALIGIALGRQSLTQNSLHKNLPIGVTPAGCVRLIFRPVRLPFEASGCSFFSHALQVSRKSGTGNTEQFCRSPLVAICLFVNELDVPLDGAIQRQIRV
jgi:hypothetical protein